MWDDGGESEGVETSPTGTLGHLTAVCDLLNPFSRGEKSCDYNVTVDEISHDYYEITTLFLIACTQECIRTVARVRACNSSSPGKIIEPY